MDYSNYKDLAVSRDGHVLTICINRAKERNTLNPNIVEEIINIFELVDQDDQIRVVILTAEPTAPAFCSGADISGGWDVLWSPEAVKEGPQAHRDDGGRAAIAIYRCRKITISAVNGHAAGAGLTACQLPFDIRFIWAGAKLTFPFVRRGIIPEATSSYILPRLLGHSRANSLLLTGETVTPDSPHIRDLYHQILPTRDAVYPAAKALADELAAKTSQISVALTKGLLQHTGDSIEETHLLDSKAIQVTASSKDAAEGVKAFFEKRAPKYAGVLSKDLPDWFPWWRRLDIKHLKSKM